MKRALVIAVVAVVLLTAIPLVTGMPPMACADCDLGLFAASSCAFAILTAMVAIAVTPLVIRLRLRHPISAALLIASGLYRPPRLA